MVLAVVAAFAARTAQMPLVKMLHQPGVAKAFVQQFAQRKIHVFLAANLNFQPRYDMSQNNRIIQLMKEQKRVQFFSNQKITVRRFYFTSLTS